MPSIVLAPVHCHLLKTWTVLAKDGTQHALTGTLTETVLATIAVPGATLGPNGILRINALWSMTNNANNKTPRIKFGSVLFYENNFTTTASLQHLVIIRNRNSQAIQIGQPLTFLGFAQSQFAVVTATIDTSASQNIQFTGQLANTGDTLTLEAYSVEAMYGA